MKIYFIGIGGISNSALAKILHKNGHVVEGSDIHYSQITQNLENMGITVHYGHSKNNITGQDLVVYTAAIQKDNEELIEAKKQNIKVISRAELLGMIASDYTKVISVAGTHGKTTTTGMIATIFLYANKNPTIHIGGVLPIINGNVYCGKNQYFITEACEYCDSFLSLNSDYSVILNVEKDHMDYFKNIGNLQNSFKNFANNTKQHGKVILNCDDRFLNHVNINNKKICYSMNNRKANLYAENIGKNNQKYFYNLIYNGKDMGKIELSIEGKHNIYNSLAAISVALGENIDIETIKLALKNYKSSERRFQKISDKNAVIIHDYAHHPTEIAASINAAKGLTQNKLVVVFEPHTFSRTQYLWKEFCECFAGADKLILLPIYPAREQPIDGITSENLSKNIMISDCEYCSTFAEAYKILKTYDIAGNTILILGAGTIVELTKYFE